MPITPEELAEHHRQVAEAILLGRVVPFLGAGVNLVDRGPEAFQTGVNFPSGGELAACLAAIFHYPVVRPCPVDLARVAQYADLMRGDGALYEALRPIFHTGIAPTSAHRFLAGLPSPFGSSAGAAEARHPLIVTTNYDDLLERQYEAGCADKDYDAVFYWPKSGEQSLFYHSSCGGEAIPIRDAANYSHAFFESRPSVLKIHGTIRREDASQDAYVITENDYVTYLADNTLESLLPRRLLKKLQTNHLLFMGYSLQDLNLRVFLQRLKRSHRSYRAWAVVRDENTADRVFWERSGIQIIPIPLADYLSGLSAAIHRVGRGI
jgi:hypothetical protein